jgi:hypothetical protein
MTDLDTDWAIDASDVNYLQVVNCAFEGGDDPQIDRQAIRCRVVDASDASYGRFNNN